MYKKHLSNIYCKQSGYGVAVCVYVCTYQGYEVLQS